MSNPKHTPTRVAVILPPEKHWDASIWRVLEALCSDTRFQLAALETAPANAPSFGKLLAGYLAIEARLIVPRTSVPTPEFDQRRAEVKTISDAAPDQIDVILDLVELADSALDAKSERARLGVWRLSTSSAVAGLAEAFSGAAMSRVTLSAYKDCAWQTQAEANYDVKFLATHNRAYLREKAVHLLVHALANIGAPKPQTSAATATPPLALIPYAGRVLAQAFRRLRAKLGARLGWRPGRFELRVCAGTPLDFKLAEGVDLQAPKGHFWADPFVHTKGTETHVFHEDFDYARKLGHLAVARLDGETATVLGDTHRPSYHLSYPHVLDHEGEVFMLLESGQIARQELWRATDYPLKWTLETTVFEGVRCADTTVFQHDGVWWLFTNICRDSFADFCSELYAYRIDGPTLTKIEPHRLNPIVVGADRARGAGRVFTQDGRMYRPSQDNTHGSYGYGLNIMEIEALTLETYHERRVRHITPTDAPHIIGCHHIDRIDEGRVIVDVRYR